MAVLFLVPPVRQVMSQNSHLRVNNSVSATFQEKQAEQFFFPFLFWSIHKCISTVKDLGFSTYVNVHFSLHHKLSLWFTQPCTCWKYLIGVNDVFGYSAFVTDVTVSVLHCKWIWSEIIERSSANLGGFRFCGAGILNAVEMPVSTCWCAHSRLRN